MRNWIKWICMIAALPVLAGLGLVYWMYSDARGIYNYRKDLVDVAVRKLEQEDPEALGAAGGAKFLLHEIRGITFVSASEFQALRDRLDKAMEAARKKRPMKSVLWQLGWTYTQAVVDCQYADVKEAQKSDRRYHYWAWLAELNPNFSLDQSRTPQPVSKVRFVQDRLSDFTKQVEAKYGTADANLFRMSSCAVLGSMAIQGRDTPEPGLYSKEIARLGTAADLPEKLWKPFVDGLEQQPRLPNDKMERLLVDFENSIAVHLGGLATAQPGQLGDEPKK